MSVALATFNGERLLGEQLASLAEQTVLPAELVVSDDRSEDGTLAVVREFAKASPFPVHLSQPERRLGHADNFLRAAALCRSELVAFCDQDDVWLSQKLERCVAAFDSDSVQLVCHAVETVDEQLRPAASVYPPRIRRTFRMHPTRFDPWFLAFGLSMVFRADLLRFYSTERPQAQGWPAGTPMGHDEWVYFLATALGDVVVLAEPLVLYRQHGGNVAGATFTSSRPPVRRSRSGVLQKQAVLAREYAEFAEHLATGASRPDDRSALDAAAAFYRAVADRQAKRLALHRDGASRRRRASVLAQLLVTGAYGARRSGRFGPRSLVKDALVLVAGTRG